MEKMRLLFLKLSTICVAFILIAANINIVFANGESKQNNTLPPALPDFLEKYFEYQAEKAQLNSTRVNQMRALWTQQLAKNQEQLDSMYEDPNRGVFGGFVNQDFTYYPSYMLEYIRPEAFYGGVVYSPTNVFGQPDESYAELYTPTYDNAMANIVGEMSGSSSSGNVHIFAALTQEGYEYYVNNNYHGNYVLIEVSNDWEASLEEWMEGFVGFAQITSTNELDYFIGGLPLGFQSFRYINVGAVVMEQPNTWDLFNDIYIDAVCSTVGNSPMILTIPSVDGGSTNAYDPWGHYLLGTSPFLVTEGETVEVVATPGNTYSFVNWDLDSNNIGDTNPTTVTMDNDHTIEPVFEISSTLVWVDISVTDYDMQACQGYEIYDCNVWIDDNWLGCGPLSVQLNLGMHTTR
jgi:hypothetical protein